MQSTKEIIEQTKKWIFEVVIGCNFCPFANKVLKQNAVHYRIEFSEKSTRCIESFLEEMKKLDEDESIDTSFIILPAGFKDFDSYLDLVHLAERSLKKNGYEGIYQVASFHPLYLFAGSSETDAANYTNRSIYPMLHILREASIDKALKHYSHPEDIPNTNIAFAKDKGLTYMKMLRDSCMNA